MLGVTTVIFLFVKLRHDVAFFSSRQHTKFSPPSARSLSVVSAKEKTPCQTKPRMLLEQKPNGSNRMSMCLMVFKSLFCSCSFQELASIVDSERKSMKEEIRKLVFPLIEHRFLTVDQRVAKCSGVRSVIQRLSFSILLIWLRVLFRGCFRKNVSECELIPAFIPWQERYN